MTFDSIVNSILLSSLDLPAGTIKTDGGEILLRTKGQAYTKADFEKIIIFSREDGTVLKLNVRADINKKLERMALTDAVRTAGVARFRAIIVTSLTTFAGLMPLMFERSTQA